MECLEEVVHVRDNSPARLDHHQQIHRSTEDAISTAFYSVITNFEIKSRYIRMLFVDLTSAFNTRSPMKLTGKLNTHTHTHTHTHTLERPIMITNLTTI